jgi:outer membrane lipoprotein-sorting protein
MNSLDRTLELFAREEPDAAAIQEAQRKLEARISDAPLRKRAHKPHHVGRWLAAAASAAAAVVAALWMPLAPTTALAFSNVQRHFRDFDTLRFVMEQRMNGKPTMNARVSMRKDGSVRTEIGDQMVVIVNSTEQRVLSLLNGPRIAMVSPLQQTATPNDALRWLDDVRDFQGAARLLSETRLIGGHKARGWELQTPSGNIVLWATADGLPLEMNLDQAADIDLRFDFEFNPRLAAESFSTAIPAGYTERPPED